MYIPIFSVGFGRWNYASMHCYAGGWYHGAQGAGLCWIFEDVILFFRLMLFFQVNCIVCCDPIIQHELITMNVLLSLKCEPFWISTPFRNGTSRVPQPVIAFPSFSFHLIPACPHVGRTRTFSAVLILPSSWFRLVYTQRLHSSAMIRLKCKVAELSSTQKLTRWDDFQPNNIRADSTYTGVFFYAPLHTGTRESRIYYLFALFWFQPRSERFLSTAPSRRRCAVNLRELGCVSEVQATFGKFYCSWWHAHPLWIIPCSSEPSSFPGPRSQECFTCRRVSLLSYCL